MDPPGCPALQSNLGSTPLGANNLTPFPPLVPGCLGVGGADGPVRIPHGMCGWWANEGKGFTRID